ncbi:MAG: hypothetical protein WDZ56_01590 [Candidatus Paceibacterota bacterium]
MSRESLIFLLGIITFFLPVVGVPPEWKEYSLWGIGILLVLIGISLKRSAYLRRINDAGGELHTDSFVESQPSLLDVPPEKSQIKEEAG